MKTRFLWMNVLLLVTLLLAGCSSAARVGELRSESQSVELGDARSVRVDINLGAGELDLTGGAEKLLEASFNYNVAKIKPEVEYSHSTLVVRQPDVIRGMPDLRNITDYRNDWDLRLYDEVPMDLKVDVGGGSSNLQLAGLSLTGLDVSLGAGISTIDLSGDWVHDLDVAIDAGAADLTVRLPKDVGVRVEVDPGASMIEAQNLAQNESTYTNAAYGVSPVTLQVKIDAGIGIVKLEVEEAAALQGPSPVAEELTLIPFGLQ